uniref:Uncharacterized protein n=1 Tax=Romanomermis culicivorax TaxID=13658 RepID=A0A915KUM3_ROMCU
MVTTAIASIVLLDRLTAHSWFKDRCRNMQKMSKKYKSEW